MNAQLGQASSKGNISIKSSNPKIITQQNNLLYSPERRPGLVIKDELSDSKDYSGMGGRVAISNKPGVTTALKGSQTSLNSSIQGSNTRDETSRGRKFQES